MHIEDITAKTLKTASRPELHNLRLRFVQLWNKHFKNNESALAGANSAGSPCGCELKRADFMAKYRLLVKEIVARKLTLNPLDIDRAIAKAKIYGLDVPELPEMVVIPAYVSVSGGYVRNPQTADDVDVVIRAEDSQRNESDELKIARALTAQIKDKTIHFIYSPTGPHSTNIPAYDLVLRPADQTKRVEVKEDYGKSNVDEIVYFAGLDIWDSDKRADYNIVARNLEGTSVLDLGCGPGRIMKELSNSGFNVQGIDKSKIAQRMCMEKHLKCTLGDLEKECLANQPTSSVDNVIGLHVLEHLENPEHIVADAVRIAKSKVIFVVPLGKRMDQTHKQVYETIEDVKKFCGTAGNVKRISGGNNTVAILIDSERFVKAQLVPFGPYTPPKPTMSHITDAFSVDDIWDWVEGRTLVAEAKLNGFRALLEKRNVRVRIKTEGGQDLTRKFPDVVSLLSKIPGDFILDASMGIEKKGRPLPRIKLMTLMADKPVIAEDEVVVFTLFDMPYHNSDLHLMPWSTRRTRLEKFYQSKLKSNPHFDITGTRFPEGKQGLDQAFKAFSVLPQSEGMMLKDVKSTWSTDGSETGWAKIKIEAEIKVKVLKVNKTKTGNYVYLVGILSMEGSAIILGKTFSTKIKAKIDDVLTVGVEEIIPVEDGTISWLGPRVIDIDPDREAPYDIEQIVGIAERANILQKATATNQAKAEGNINYKVGDVGVGVLQIHIMGIDDEDVPTLKAASSAAYSARHNPGKLRDILVKAIGGNEAAHIDWRMVKRGDNHFEGGEIFIGNFDGLTKLEKFNSSGKLRFHFKTPHAEDPEAETVQGPVEWMKVGSGGSFRLFPPGAVGARSKTHGAMMILDHFSWKITLADNHAKKFLISGSKLIPPGEYLIAYVPVEEGRIWMISKLKAVVAKYFEIAKADQHIVTGVVYAPNEVDAQGDYTTATEIEIAMFSFMESAQKFGVNHESKSITFGFDKDSIAKVLACYIVPETHTIRCSDGRTEEIVKGSWMLTTRIIDMDVWKKIKSGEITGYSMGGKSKSK